MNTILIILAVVLVGWFLYSWLSVRNIEKPKYQVVSTTSEYEIREYSPYIIAETTITGARNRSDATNKGFPIIAGYIFGDNTSKDKIDMTVPVNTEASDSEKIAMTVPVNTEKIAMTAPVNTEKIAMTVPVNAEETSDGIYKVSFVMPSKYSIETLPTPNDSRVELREMPKRTVAVRIFSWSTGDTAVEREKEALLSALAKDSVETMGEVNVAFYNPPWTIPFMLRNEVQIEIK